MESTLQFCPSDVAWQRADLKIRPVPEIGLCMVYRPRPSRIIALNLGCWLLLELCDGSRIEDILGRYINALVRRGRGPPDGHAELGLQALVDSNLITVSSCR